MNLTRSLRVAFAVLLAVHLASAFASVALLGRMRPAIGRIIEQNVRSLEAAEDMLAVLAAAGGEAPTLADAERFRAAFQRAAENITDTREEPLIESMRQQLEPALSGDRAAIQSVTASLRDLAAVNRSDMQEADERAKQLGSAGAWAVVFLALLTLSGGLVALRRLDRSVLRPLEELYDVVDRHRAGELHRRCGPATTAASELSTIMRLINRILDEGSQGVRRAPADEADRSTLLQLLDRLEGATFVLETDGKIIAANRQGMDALADDDDLRDRLTRAVQDGAEGVDVVVVDDDRRIATVG